MKRFTVLVTGGAGFIGSNFIRYLLSNEDNTQIVNLDKLTYAGNLENLGGIKDKYLKRYCFVKGDICNRGLVRHIFKENEPNAVINFAAESHVDRSIDKPDNFVRTNIQGTANLLNVARHFWKTGSNNKRFLQVSTDEVYGSLPEDQPEVKFKETDTIDPHSPYSASKASADQLAQSYYYTYDFPIIITRCSNNYGPYQFPEKLIPLMIQKATNEESLPVYGDGKNVRDWIYVKDHCEALLKVIREGKIGEIYNIGGQTELKNIQIVKKILNYLNKPHNLIEYVEDRPGHDRRYAMNITKIKRELDWEPKYEFEEKIEDTIDWYLNNSDWVNSVTSDEHKQWLVNQYEI